MGHENARRTNAASARRAIDGQVGKDAGQGTAKAPQTRAAQAAPKLTPQEKARAIAARRRTHPERTVDEILREVRFNQYDVDFDVPLPNCSSAPVTPRIRRPRQARSTRRTKDDKARALAVLAKVGVTDPWTDPRIANLLDAYRNGEFLAGLWEATFADELAMANALKALELHTELAERKRAGLLSQLRASPPGPTRRGPREVVGVRAATGCVDAEGWTDAKGRAWKEAAAAVFLLEPNGRSYESIEKTFSAHDLRRLKEIADSGNKSRA